MSHECPTLQSKSKPPATQLFDIMPIKGVLRPGENEIVTFAFFAYPGVKASVNAMCIVEGGPSYQVGCILVNVFCFMHGTCD